MQRVGGIINVKVDGDLVRAKGEWTYNLGVAQRTTVNGADRPHGYTEEPRPSRIEGEITDAPDLDLKKFLKISDATVTLELANGKVIVQRNATQIGDGDVGTKEGNVKVAFESADEADEVRA